MVAYGILEAIACSEKESLFVVLVLLPESSKTDVASLHTDTGAILLFNAGEPVPIASWFVTKAKGGTIAFIQRSISMDDSMDESSGPSLLAYVNGDHEYALFNPQGFETYERKARFADSVPGLEGTRHFGYASIYGELPEFKLKTIKASADLVKPSEKPWETIFDGPSHSLPPLIKLCSTFLESLMEKRTSPMVE